MSGHRRNQAVVIDVWNDLVSAWSQEEQACDDEAPSTGVFVRRAPRDSYTHERPLISATLDLHAEDLTDLGRSLEEDAALEIHLRPTLRPE